MSRYIGPKLRRIRALQTHLSGLSTKSMEHRNTRPGQHGANLKHHSRTSDFAIQLLEKQKLQFNYGLREKQLSRLVKEARKGRTAAGNKLAELLERRLDNAVFRAGFALSIPQARQLVSHGHIIVNGEKVDIASYRLSIGDVIGPRPKSTNLIAIKNSITSSKFARPDWLRCDYQRMQAEVVLSPSLSDLSVEVDISKVLEYYAKRG